MAEYSLNVLHCGGNEEEEFITHLREAERNRTSSPFTIEYNNYLDKQVMETLRNLESEMSIMMLVSKMYFDMLWRNEFKYTNAIINELTTKLEENTLHVWLDVDENYVRQKNTALCDGGRHVNATELLTLGREPSQNDDILDRIHLHLQSGLNRSNNELYNFAVDDEIDEMRKNYQQADIVCRTRFPDTVVLNITNAVCCTDCVPVECFTPRASRKTTFLMEEMEKSVFNIVVP